MGGWVRWVGGWVRCGGWGEWVTSPLPPPRTHPPTRTRQVEGHKRYEFLEAAVSAMDAHLKFFERGQELLEGLGPYLHHAREVGGCLEGCRGGREGHGGGLCG